MANIRGLKKDIDYVASELIIECFTYNYLFPEKNQDALAEIISDSLTMRSGLIKKVNRVKPNSGNPAKKQFKMIRESFKLETEKMVERIENLEKE